MIDKHFADIDYSPGKLVHFDLALDPNLPLAQQLDSAQEDLLQAEFPLDIVLDVGWHLCASEQKCFQIRVVENDNWEKPLFYTEASDVSGLVAKTREALGFCKGYLQSQLVASR